MINLNNYMRKIFLLFLIAPSVTTLVNASEEVSRKEDNTEWSRRADALPPEHLRCDNDPYFEGYIQALLDMHYHEFSVVAKVHDCHVTLSNLPNNESLADSIRTFIADIPGVKEVTTFTPEENSSSTNHNPPIVVVSDKKVGNTVKRISGTWVPQTSLLFQPLVADPRRIHYSLGYRGSDRVISKRVVTISLGDEWGIFRWNGMGKYQGDAQIGVEACVWSIFDIKGRSGDWGTLMNSDFHVGIIGTFAADKLSLRARLYHQSCHLGDEKMVRDGAENLKQRLNPSMEAVELVSAYQVDPSLRFYGGGGVILRSDKSFKLKPLYLMYGAEKRLAPKKNFHHKTYSQPFLACHIKQSQTNDWTPDITAAIGWEWSKLEGIGRKVRTYLELHHGYSQEGQFSKKRNDYWSINLSYGF